jgi:hypothetical protein
MSSFHFGDFLTVFARSAAALILKANGFPGFVWRGVYDGSIDSKDTCVLLRLCVNHSAAIHDKKPGS